MSGLNFDSKTDGSKIFISYASEDSQIAKKLYNDLKKKGFAPWLDRQNILPGQIWKNVIPHAIKQSSYFLFLISSYSLGKRGYVQTELRMGLDILNEIPPDDIYLIPVYVENCKVSEERLEHIQAVFLYNSYEDGLKQLLRTLEVYENRKVSASIQPDNDKTTDSDEESPTLATLIKKAEAEKLRKKEMHQRLEKELENYDLLLNNYDNTYKDEAWQIICTIFPDLTQGVHPGDTWSLILKAGLFKAGEIYKEPITGMNFMWVPSGCFMMGSNSSEGYSNEKPVHEVCLDGFWMGKYQVTQGQYEKIIGENPSHFKSGNDYPVEKVSWNDAKKFISKLNEKSDKQFSLPTEAQWEYAARSGGKDEKYAGANDVDKVAWYYKNSGDKTHAVGTKAPNDLGIYDMSGNVWEWCEDVYDEKAYSKHERNNPVINTGSSGRVVRGGSWVGDPGGLRTANRSWYSADFRNGLLGFRLCLSPVRQSGQQ